MGQNCPYRWNSSGSQGTCQCIALQQWTSKCCNRQCFKHCVLEIRNSLKNHRPSVVQKTPQMIFRWLAESGGMQVFPPVVVLAQMCVSLCHGTSPLRHKIRWRWTKKGQVLWPKFLSLHTYLLDMSSLMFHKMFHISYFPWSKWSCCSFLWQQEKELSFCSDEAPHTDWGAWLPKTKHGPLQS